MEFCGECIANLVSPCFFLPFVVDMIVKHAAKEWEGNFFQGKILKTIYLAAMLFVYTLRPLLTRPKSPTFWHLINHVIVFGVNNNCLVRRRNITH